MPAAARVLDRVLSLVLSLILRRARLRLALIASAAAIASATITGSVGADPRVAHAGGLATKKAPRAPQPEGPPAPLLATLVQTHTEERVLLDALQPPLPRFDALLSDRVTGASLTLDPRLLDLLRTIAAQHTKDGALPRIELVSGFRSPKLNEMLRKKGHHVASHSQHSLGHAVDFRIVEDGAARGVDPRDLAKAIRASGWTGGLGIYLLADDWFVHADVGPNRNWGG
jgi:uncharacterized protein YcbK (DUF882 family)